MRNEIGKALIQPEVIPPFHGDKVSKPVVRQLVRNGVGEVKFPFCGDLFLENIEIVEGDHSCIFHSSPFVFMSEYLIIFIEGEREVEEPLEESH